MAFTNHLISIRGYQFQPSGVIMKKPNPSAYKKLQEPEPLSDNGVLEESLMSPSVYARDLEDMGFAKQMG